MSSKLKQFLKTYKVTSEKADGKKAKKNEKEYTHTSMSGGLYNIPDDKRQELHELIIDSVFKQKMSCNITEKNVPVKPVLIDFDFRFPQEDPVRQHNNDHIKRIVELYDQAIRKYTEIPNEKEIRCFVFERNAPYPHEGNLKDGIHFMYPEVIINTAIQHVIRNEVKEVCMKEVFDNAMLGKMPLKNSIDDVIDKKVIDGAPWTMYGCTKPGHTRYNLTHVYGNVFDKHEDKCSTREYKSVKYSHLELINLLSTHKSKDDPEFGEYFYEVRESQKGAIQKYIEEEREKKTNKSITAARNYISRKRPKKKAVTSEEAKKQILEAQQLVDLLAPYRAEDYEMWMYVGWCLKNISDSLLDCWINFSKQSDEKFQEGVCEQKWMEFQEGSLGVGSLHRWARLDNYDRYNELRSEFISGYIFRSLSQTTQDVAEVVWQMYRHQYVCVSSKGELWYEFYNHRWHECKHGVTLKKRIGNEVLNEYLNLVSHYNVSAIEYDNEQKDQSLFRAKGLTDVTYKLRDLPFKEKVMRECNIMFYNPSFEKELDSDPYLIGFENGVVDLKTGKFRDGCPEDKVSLSTGTEYVDIEFDEEDEIVMEIMTFMRQVFPDEDLREYVLDLFSSYLQGTNPDEKFHIFTGVGGNGKSKLVELLEMAMGDYTFKMPITLLTQKRAASNSANPELARTKGRRVGSFQEPDENERINVGFMKELTGGDKIMVRALYKEPFEFKPQFKLFLCCNHMPKVPGDDEGTWRRVRVVPFKSRFVNDPDPANNYEFERDEYLSQKMANWKEMFMTILVHRFRNYRVKGLREPDEVMKATNEYRAESDIYTQFRDDKLIRDDEGFFRLDECYIIFKNWFAENLSGKPPIRREFRSIMERKLGQKYGRTHKGWEGWRLINEDEPELESGPNEFGRTSVASRKSLVTPRKIAVSLRKTPHKEGVNTLLTATPNKTPVVAQLKTPVKTPLDIKIRKTNIAKQ